MYRLKYETKASYTRLSRISKLEALYKILTRSTVAVVLFSSLLERPERLRFSTLKNNATMRTGLYIDSTLFRRLPKLLAFYIVCSILRPTSALI